MDELEAVNAMLSEIGSDAVNDLTIGHPDVSNARKVLDRTHRQIQRKGWWFNTDYNVTLSPEPVTKKIRVQSVVRLDIPNYFVVERGGYLYDRNRQSFQFTESLVAASIVRYLVWNDLPDVVKDAALYKASADFVRAEIEDTTKEQTLYGHYQATMRDVVQENLNAEQYNMFNKARVLSGRAGVRPYRTGAVRSRFFGTPDA